LIDAERPDLIVAGQEPLAWYVPQIARDHGIPSVLLLRGGPTWGIVDGSFPEAHSRRWLDAFRGADRIVAVSRNFEEGLRARGVEGVCTIQNHVDLSRFFPAPKDHDLLEALDLRGDEIVVVHASKIEPRKRPLDLVAVAGEARETANLVYVVVGEGPMLGEMEEACRRLGVADHFRFVGWVPYERMPAFFNLADIVVQPSEAEGLSRVYLESMACGRVLVATDIPAAREVIQHGKNGLLFKTGSLGSLAQTIRLAANDPALRERIGRNARASVLSHSLDRMADQYASVFRDVLETSPSRATPGRA
jgi:glycosyltransferase involved in cell wall biosynthesis